MVVSDPAPEALPGNIVFSEGAVLLTTGQAEDLSGAIAEGATRESIRGQLPSWWTRPYVAVPDDPIE